jgi:hypothetical protein
MRRRGFLALVEQFNSAPKTGPEPAIADKIRIVVKKYAADHGSEIIQEKAEGLIQATTLIVIHYSQAQEDPAIYDRVADIWTAERDRKLSRIIAAASELRTAVRDGQGPLRNRFEHGAIFRYSTLTALATVIDRVSREAGRLRPAVIKNPGNYLNNAFIAALAKAWSQATDLDVGRSERRDKGPLQFVSAVVQALEPGKEIVLIQKRVKSALKYFEDRSETAQREVRTPRTRGKSPD